MSTISQLQYVEMLARNNRHAGLANAPDAVKEEGDLHKDIKLECRRRGWMYFHGSMAHRTRRTPGEPDFFILAEAGRVFAVECKSRTGKLSTAQLGVIAWGKRLGHTVHVVQSMAEFREAIK